MASFTNMLLTVFAIQLIMTIFGFAAIPGDALYTWITNPTSWDNSTLPALLGDIFVLVGAASIIVGLVFYKSDFMIFSGLVSIFFSFGKGLQILFVQISAQAGNNPTVAMLFVSPIIILYVMTLIGWWRGRNG